MDCPKCQGFLLLEPGPLAFDDYRCLNCGNMVRLAAHSQCTGPRQARVNVGTPSPETQRRKRSKIPRADRVGLGLCIDCCARRDGESPRCKDCRAKVAASVQKCWLKKHPNAKIRVQHGAVA